MRLLWITAFVVLIDQVTKVIVLRTMVRHESIPVLGDWLKFTFTENPGMAFGINFGPRGMVTIFSIIATVLIILYLYQVRHGYRPYVASLALILGGAIGNIIDRVFYGVFLGYDGYFTGKVVDFIHVDVWRGILPEGLPFIGGAYLSLFPIWNVADMAIVVGVVGILVFQQRFHMHHVETQEVQPGVAAGEPTRGDAVPLFSEAAGTAEQGASGGTISDARAESRLLPHAPAPPPAGEEPLPPPRDQDVLNERQER